MNVYGELYALLTQRPAREEGALFGTLTGISPLTVTVRGTALTEGLYYAEGRSFSRTSIGRALLVIPCEGGLYLGDFVAGA